ncbi:MAG TPA: tetratricopeptide repeat protein [Longimicrobiaceae bacterium]|nr:tetratricopeptide repeat protein [Longimicrobiaceae bacterium]
MAQSIASRSRRPQGVTDADDVFIARTLQFSAWARRNARLVIAAAVIALVLIVGAVYYRWDQANRLERAATEFMFLEQTAASGNVALATRDIQQFIQRFDGTPYADEARVLLGQIHMQQGEPQQAVEALRDLPGRIRRSPVGVQGALLLGSAHAAAGDTAAAVATYTRVADEARLDFQREEALNSAALLREQAGDYTRAAELYRQLIGMTEEGSFERSLYEMRLAEAEGRARGQ